MLSSAVMARRKAPPGRFQSHRSLLVIRRLASLLLVILGGLVGISCGLWPFHFFPRQAALTSASTALLPTPAVAPRILTPDDPLFRGLPIKNPTMRWVANEGPTRLYEPEEGIVSYYWKPQKTADGGRFDPDSMTAAHNTHPLGTIVRCTCLDTGRSITVIISDRGPYVDGRILDLSRAAARKLGLTRPGVTHCRVEVLAYPLTP